MLLPTRLDCFRHLSSLSKQMEMFITSLLYLYPPCSPLSCLCLCFQHSLVLTRRLQGSVPPMLDLQCLLRPSAVAKLQNQLRSIQRGMEKDNVVYIHSKILFKYKEEESIVVCKRTEATGDETSKRSASEKQIPHFSFVSPRLYKAL